MDTVSPGTLLARARRVFVKIGSSLLVDPEGGLREGWLEGLARDIARCRARGQEMAIVSSGSIALGRHALGLGPGELSLDQAQAAAAVGQIRLARAYERALAGHGISAAQVLVTLEDSQNRRRYLNSRATLEALLSMNCVPVVNENDTVATDEIRFGDNDRLAAQVAALAGADFLCLLSDIDGLYDGDPAGPGAKRLDIVDQITPRIEAMAGDAGTSMAKGGMKTKVMAARTAMAAGCAMAICRGNVSGPLSALENGGNATLFLPNGSPAAARKRWIASMKAQGSVHIDAGAVAALRQGKSLLPAGVAEVSGEFTRGDPVDVLGPDGARAAKGLIAYSADETRHIAGAQSKDIAAILGYPGRAALIHRDDMAV